MAWARKQLLAGTLEQTWFSAEELEGITAILNFRGTDDEFKDAVAFEEELKQQDGQIGKVARATFAEPLEKRVHQAKLMKSVYREQISFPYLETYRRGVRSRPDLYGTTAAPALVGKVAGSSGPGGTD